MALELLSWEKIKVTTHIMTEKISKEKLLNKFSIDITYRTKQHLDILHSHVMGDDSKISDYGDFVNATSPTIAALRSAPPRHCARQ